MSAARRPSLVQRALFVCITAYAAGVFAKAGVHGRSVSTWDTTRSSVVFWYAHGWMLEGGLTNQAGYNANFTSTTGRLSAQFGLQFLQYHPKTLERSTFGVGTSAVAVYGFPIGSRFDNGMPRAALTFFGGAMPSAVFNGEYNYFSIPLVLGMGIEINPVRYVSLIPWGELAPSFNIDTVIRPAEFENYLKTLDASDIQVVYGPNGEIVDVLINDATANELVAGIVGATTTMDMNVSLRMRAGLSLVFHLGNAVDLQVNFAVVQQGDDFGDKPTLSLGTGLAIAWDDPPAAIMPAEYRLRSLTCDDIAPRCKACAPRWREQKPASDAAPRASAQAPRPDAAPTPVAPPAPKEPKPRPSPQTPPAERPQSPPPVTSPAPSGAPQSPPPVGRPAAPPPADKPAAPPAAPQPPAQPPAGPVAPPPLDAPIE